MQNALTVSIILELGLMSWLFFDGPSPRAEAGGNPLPACKDINGDGQSDVSDAIFFFSWRFLGGPEPLCAPSTGPSALPHTGQRKCHDPDGAEIPCDTATCPGQDGAYAMGCPLEGRFVDNDDGTVTDICTNLMWQKDTADVSGGGQIDGADRLAWCDALKYCENLDFAGHDDWRLPNVRELQSIVDYGSVNPAIDPVFEAFSSGYWSSSPNINAAFQAWYIIFDTGGVRDYGDAEGYPHSVRAVRSNNSPQKAGAAGAVDLLRPCQDINGDGLSDVSDGIFFLRWLFLGGPEPTCQADNVRLSGLPDSGQTVCYGIIENAWVPVSCAEAECPGQDGDYVTGCPSEERFVDNGDGTVTDTCTGLMWQKETADLNGDGQWTVDVDTLPWCDSLDYCENLDFAGHDDWRLPNVRELQSIVDYGRVDPAIDPVFGAVSAPYWSSTCLAGDAGCGWFVSFLNGISFVDTGAVSPYIRPVRGQP